jgi:NADH-quinone oxidoreductase subunit I
MSLKHFKNRNVGTQNYRMLDLDPIPQTGWEKFKQVVRRTLSIELLIGLSVTMREMMRALFGGKMHTTKYPFEKLPIGPRYRAIHEMKRLLESGHERCIACGLCEKICPANAIRIEAHYGEDGRKAVDEYTINFGRCIFCGYCAEVCPELAITHGGRYETASEQRSSFSLFGDMLTPIDQLTSQQEFQGYGSVSPHADAAIKKTPLAY